ncbi:septum site-determining protein MinC [Roseateles sp. SL47]|uniref:septum site-determining protein MinC n=1 Tax=Roseateles sp. SL47 TaxID=2995138 RepID=UPI002271CC7B|nr:septum site-determining protein MinC [Roseateles sp. SL47]WAC72487.1 septum site-determining protein MinC [Roseateles sp. SL47]
MAQALAGTTDTTAARSATAGKSPDLFELKSASLSLLSLVLKSADMAALAHSLTARLGETPDAFHHDPLLLDLSQLPPPQAQEGTEADTAPAGPRLDLATLLPLLRQHRLQPVGVVGANEAELAQAAALGLAEAPEAAAPVARPEPRVETVVQQVIKEVVVERQVEVAVMTEARTVFVDKPLRSGQQVYAKGADLVVLALVNHGAEVIADGNIHIYAPLRGKAIAGARGNTDARIFAQCLEAELIAIAGIYRTTENPLPDNVRGKAAMVRLDGEKLLMDPLPQ